MGCDRHCFLSVDSANSDPVEAYVQCIAMRLDAHGNKHHLSLQLGLTSQWLFFAHVLPCAKDRVGQGHFWWQVCPAMKAWLKLEDPI